MTTFSDINRIQNKYAWYTLGNKVGILEKQTRGTWDSITEASKSIRIHVTKMADPLIQSTNTTTTYGNNLITNFDFEQVGGDGLANWTANPTYAIESSDMYAGAGALKTVSAERASQQFDIDGDASYYLTYWAKGLDASGCNGLPEVEIYNVNETAITFTESQSVFAPTWVQYKTIVPSPGSGAAGTETITLYLNDANWDGTPCASGVLWDNISFQKINTSIETDHLLQEPELPRRFHMSIVNKVLSDFYRDPRNPDEQRAMFYTAEYQKDIIEGKKHARANHISTGYIQQRDF